MKLFRQKGSGRYREVSDEEILIAAIEVLQERGLRSQARMANIMFLRAMSASTPPKPDVSEDESDNAENREI